jgi:hypothetical protein
VQASQQLADRVVRANRSQDDRSFPASSPVTMIGWRAPAERTALTRRCMPAVVQPVGSTHPLRQQFQLMRSGSLYRSKSTAGSVLKVRATENQKAGAWARSAIGCWPVARCRPGALQCKSKITYRRAGAGGRRMPGSPSGTGDRRSDGELR